MPARGVVSRSHTPGRGLPRSRTHLGSSRRRSARRAPGSRCGWRSGTRCARPGRGPRSAGAASGSGTARCRRPASPGRTGPGPRARPGAAVPPRPAWRPGGDTGRARPPGSGGGPGPRRRPRLREGRAEVRELPQNPGRWPPADRPAWPVWPPPHLLAQLASVAVMTPRVALAKGTTRAPIKSAFRGPGDRASAGFREGWAQVLALAQLRMRLRNLGRDEGGESDKTWGSGGPVLAARDLPPSSRAKQYTS